MHDEIANDALAKLFDTTPKTIADLANELARQDIAVRRAPPE